MKKAFTTIELLVVMAVLVIVVVLSISSFGRESAIDSLANNVFSILNLAKNKTVASEQASQYGVYFDTSVSPQKYILFQGLSYASRNASFDEIHLLPKDIAFSSLNLIGVGNEVVFNRLTGTTNNSGYIIINSAKNNVNKTIYLYSSGEASFNQEVVSGTGRMIDSRHVHFDLGWDVSGSTTLKFDFINVGQIRTVTMTDYFSIDDFDWEGEFVINNIVQRFAIHTHLLSPTTQLCIHRDRDENKNNEEVYVYIIQNGIEKNIAHYDNDISATIYKGNYVWNQMQIQ